jgi:hypothetical protein
MPAATTLAVVGLGVAAAGTYMQYQQGKKAAASQKKAMEMQQRIADVRSARERRTQYQQARIQRAAMLAGAAGGVGQTQSSSFITGRGSIGSQAGSNVSFLNQLQGYGQRANIFNMNALSYQTKASMWGGIAGLGTSMFNMTGSSLFADGQQPQSQPNTGGGWNTMPSQAPSGYTFSTK